MTQTSDQLVTLCGRAISMMAVKLLKDEPSINGFRATFAREFTGKAASGGLTRNVSFGRALWPLKLEGSETVAEVNPIWANPSFVMPAVASLAALFDATLSRSGQPSFRLDFEPDSKSLYGCALSSITPAQDFDGARMAVMMAGAAKSFITEPDFLCLSRWTLMTERR